MFTHATKRFFSDDSGQWIGRLSYIALSLWTAKKPWRRYAESDCPGATSGPQRSHAAKSGAAAG